MRTGARILVVVVLAVAALRLAWISDDSLITLRTVLNTTHGYGAGYNATEAVQAYTHPLWFLLWVSLGFLTNQYVLGIMLVSVALMVTAAAVLLWFTTTIARIIVIGGILLFSNAFMEYTTSGLENSLGYLAVALTFALSLTLFQRGPTRIHYFIFFGLALAAVFLTRFDLILTVLPLAVGVLWVHRRAWRSLLLILVPAAIPVIMWLVWSWVTYSTVLPNTFLAKTNTNIPQTELVVQGLRYLWVGFTYDPVTLVAISAGLIAGFLARNVLLTLWAGGVVLYLGYLLYVGGDFMGGRFLAIPVFMSVFILARVGIANTVRQLTPTHEPAWQALVPAGVGVAVVLTLLTASVATGSTPVALSNPQEERWKFEQNLNGSVADERGFWVANGRSIKNYFDELSLWYQNPDIVPYGDGTGLNRTFRELNKAASNWPTNDGFFGNPSEVGAGCGGLGYTGIAVGPAVHLVDYCGLTDRFIAAQEFTPAEPFAWRPGHLGRDIPEGYIDALRTNDAKLMKDFVQRFELQQLWDQIRKNY